LTASGAAGRTVGRAGFVEPGVPERLEREDEGEATS
jgi:hypothetical protein